MRAIEKRLVELNQQGRSVVLIIDEAQALPTESLEALRLLSNLETEKRKLLQLVMFGQPELDERLATRGNYVSYVNGSVCSYQLRPLSGPELGRYVNHRVQIAGYKGSALFTPEIVWGFIKLREASPRLANVICHKMLLLAYGSGRHHLTIADARLAIKDTEDAQLPKRREIWWFLVVGMIAASVLAILLIFCVGVIPSMSIINQMLKDIEQRERRTQLKPCDFNRCGISSAFTKLGYGP